MRWSCEFLSALCPNFDEIDFADDGKLVFYHVHFTFYLDISQYLITNYGQMADKL